MFIFVFMVVWINMNVGEFPELQLFSFISIYSEFSDQLVIVH